MPDIEEGYHENILKLLEDYQTEINVLVSKHKIISRKFYLKHVIYGIPQILVPVIMTLVTQLDLPENKLKIVSGCGFLLTGCLSGIYNFFNFSLLSEKHDNACNKYTILKDYIQSNLSRDELYRIPADVLIEHVKNEMKNLNLYSPSVSNTCISDCFVNK